MMTGKLTSLYGPTQTSEFLEGVSVGKCNYWKRKYLDPTFHSGSWGGFRGFKFGEDGNLALHKLLWEVFEIDPNLSLGQYTELVRELGVTDITKWKIGEIFRSWGWSWKVPAQKQLKKYTPENIIYYLNWIKCVLHLDWLKAKFLDESHFVDKDLYPRKVVGPQGRPSHRVRPGRLDQSFTMTLLLDLTNTVKPFFFTIRYQSNTVWDFYTTLVDAIYAGNLRSGHILIVDNASVHFGQQAVDDILALLHEHNIRLLFLPKYSPELNPCELVFAQLKSYVRRHRYQSLSLIEVILDGLVSIPYKSIVRYYARCTSLYYRYVVATHRHCTDDHEEAEEEEQNAAEAEQEEYQEYQEEQDSTRDGQLQTDDEFDPMAVG
jgi:transposase